MSLKKASVIALFAVLAAACAPKPKAPAVYVAADATRLERLAASEIRRYIYQTTGALPAIVAVPRPTIPTRRLPGLNRSIVRLGWYRSATPIPLPGPKYEVGQ